MEWLSGIRTAISYMEEHLTDDISAQDDCRLHCGCFRPGYLHVDMIFADDAYRNQGIGSFLPAQTERQAKEKGAYLSRTDAALPQAEFFGKHGCLKDVIYEGRRTGMFSGNIYDTALYLKNT